MAPRRTRIRRARTPEAVEPLEEFPTITLRDEAQRTRLSLLGNKRVIPTRFICRDSLQRLGVYEETRTLFRGVGMSDLFTMHHTTSRDLTLEFLSSLGYTTDDYGEVTLSFRLEGMERTLTISELGDLFGLPRRGEEPRNPDLHPGTLWPALSGEPLASTQSVLISHIHHPAIRIWAKFMAFTLSAKSESNRLNSIDLAVLCGYLRPNHFRPLDMAQILFRSFKQIVEKAHTRADILLGGLITHIAVHFSYDEPRAISREETMITLSHMVNSSWIDTAYGLKWQVHNRTDLPLPSPLLPPLTPDLESYGIPAEGMPAPPGPPPILGYARQRRGPHAPVPEHPPLGFQDIMEALRHTQSGIARVETALAQVQSSQTDLQRAIYPIYDHFHHHGMLPSGHVHPTWYQPQPPSAAGGHFDPFGAGPSHRHGGDGSHMGDDYDSPNDNE